MKTLLLGEVGNRLDISENERHLSSLRKTQNKTAQKLHARAVQVDLLKQELEKQKLAIQALTRFLVEKKIVEQSELGDFIELVDAEDGVVDGKLAIGDMLCQLLTIRLFTY